MRGNGSAECTGSCGETGARAGAATISGVAAAGACARSRAGVGAASGTTADAGGRPSDPSGLNGAGKFSMPGTATGRPPMEAPNTSGDSCLTISSSGSSSRPFTMRSLTSAGATANTAAGNCSTTASHSTCTMPSPSCGTIRDCATSSVSASRSLAPTWARGTRKAPGGSCPATRSKEIRTISPAGADAGRHRRDWGGRGWCRRGQSRRGGAGVVGVGAAGAAAAGAGVVE